MYRKTFDSTLVLTLLLGLVVRSASAVSQPRPLPQNGKIAYTMRLGISGNAHVYLMDADGSNRTFLVEGWSGAWSPDGKQLLAGGGVLTLDTGKITPLF